jgi:hypothetical protein
MAFDYPTPAALAGYLRATELPHDHLSLQNVLDKLESLLSEMASDDPMHDLVGPRLQGLLRNLGSSGAPASGESVTRKMQSATDDEIFEFINKELGRS